MKLYRVVTEKQELEATGPTSQTGYRGLNARQAYDDIIKTCNKF